MQQTCSICLDVVKQSCRLRCGHFFHPQCVHRWRVTSDTCPVCKAPIECRTRHGKTLLRQMEDAARKKTSDLEKRVDNLEAFSELQSKSILELMAVCDQQQIMIETQRYALRRAGFQIVGLQMLIDS